MITNLKIKNFALIKELEIDLDNGLNVITGETGAGKSTLISAVNFALGGRVDKNNIRTGECEAVIQISFDISQNDIVKSKILDLGLEVDDILIISRKFSIDNKNENRINGQIVNNTMLKSITALLVDIYGQHDHQVLLNKTCHIDFLDNYIGTSINEHKKILDVLFAQKDVINKQINELGGDELSRAREKDMLAFQINEIKQADLKECEDEELSLKKKRFDNAQKLVAALNMVNQLLVDDECSVSNNLFNTNKTLNSISDMDNDFKDYLERLESMYIDTQDIVDSVKEKLFDLNFSEEECSFVDNRLDLIKSLKRKYGSEIKDILEFLENSETKLKNLEDSESILQKLNSELCDINSKILVCSKELSTLRKQEAKKLEKLLINELSQLGMKGVAFSVEFNEITPTKNGIDDVEFLFSANLGEPLKSLNKVISGGEMSRFMLAFKTIMGDTDKTNTLIFDEVDSGISGVTSNEVGKKLALLARTHQVLTVTHLATVASFANKHFQIVKKVIEGHTNSCLIPLDYNGELQEIARLTSGNIQSELSLAHARELKQQAYNYISAIK